MVHFTCDLCGKDLNALGDPRYVVKIEVFAGFDPNQITEEDLDDDHMEQIAEILQHDEDLGGNEALKPVRQGFRYDLCSCCRTRFVKDPLTRKGLKLFNFSNN